VASLLGEVANANQNLSFAASPGTDLSPSLRDNALLFAWSPGQAAAAPLNTFKANRGQVNTMWRIPLPLNSNP
jgi:hypothetical protein